jgi:hypothetical protein
MLRRAKIGLIGLLGAILSLQAILDTILVIYASPNTALYTNPLISSVIITGLIIWLWIYLRKMKRTAMMLEPKL